MASRTLILSWRRVDCRQTPTRSFNSRGLDFRIAPQHGDAPAGARPQAFEDLDGGGLAGAVGSEQSEDFARADFEIDAFDGLERAVVFLESCNFDGVGHFRLSTLWGWGGGARETCGEGNFGRR